MKRHIASVERSLASARWIQSMEQIVHVVMKNAKKSNASVERSLVSA